MNELATAAFAAFRFWLLVRFLNHNPVLAWIVGASEAFAVVSTVRGLIRENVSTETRGVIVPLCYCAPMLFIGHDEPNTFYLGCFMIVGTVQLCVRAYMGWHVTVGVPMFRYTLTGGPYAVIRHPLASVEIVMAVLFPMVFPSLYNWLVCALVVAASVIATVLEERFLRQFASYRAYMTNVRFRYFPGLL